MKEEVTFYESTHQYFLGKRELLSVNYCLERAGFVDFSKVPFETIERAKLIGEYVHKMAYMYGMGELDESKIEPPLDGYLKAIKNFYYLRVKKVLYLEVIVADATLGYAGTPDIVYVNHQNKVCLDDFKTPEDHIKATELQTAGYKLAFERNYKQKVHERGGVLLRDDGDFQRKSHNDPDDIHDFLAALRVAYCKIKHKITT